MLTAVYKTKTLKKPVLVKWLKQNDSLAYKSIDFLFEHFNNKEPISRSININGNQNDKLVMKQVFERCLQSDANIVALDAETNQLIGVSLQEIHVRNKDDNDGFKTFIAKPSPKHEAYNKLADKLKKDTNLFGKYPNCEKIIEHSFLSTHPKWLKEGVGTMAMLFFRNFMMKELQCDLAYSICTSFYTAKMLENWGYKEIWRIPYEDLHENEKCLFSIEPPHDSITFKLLELDKM